MDPHHRDERLDRRRAIGRITAAASGVMLSEKLAASRAFTQETGDFPANSADDLRSLYTPDATDVAVSQAVDFLISRQKNNGAIADLQYDVAMTALAIMAMAAIGVQPDTLSVRGKAMTAALDFVLQDINQDDFGYFGRRDRSRMYGHGITTLMLTEMSGMGSDVAQNTRIHASLVKALGLILKAQRIGKPPLMRGGWRYAPDSTDSDLSVSIWQLMALRS